MARLTKLNNYLKLIPGSNENKKMYQAELRNIMLHIVPNGGSKHSDLQVWYFESKTYKETCDIYLKEWKLLYNSME